MTVTFLGTGTSQGVPVIGSDHPVCLSLNSKDKRLRTSIMIEWKDHRFIIDCGPDFRQQMLRERINEINGILFTHEHADHTAGLDDIRAFTHQMGEVPLYVPERIDSNLKQRFYYIFTRENRYPGAPKANTILVENKIFPLGDKMVQPIEIIHGNLPIFGYRIEDFAYLTDVKTVEKEEKSKLQNLDVLVINALRIEPHPTHFNLAEALEFIAELKPKQAYITHISYKLGFHDEVSKDLPDHVFLAYDGLKVEIS